MRQIKFRGESLKNKKWVYGDLMRNICATRIVRYKETHNESGQRADWDYVEVDDSTVGQFTGLTDRNGKEIYEGDIVCISVSPTAETAEANERNGELMGIQMPEWINGGDIIARVSYFDGAYHFIHLQSYLPDSDRQVQEPMLNYLWHERYPDERITYDQTITVIGNIHDNPEMFNQPTEL